MISRCLVMVVVASMVCHLAAAAETYKKDDEIEIFYLKKWYPAKVVATNARGEVLAEYEWAGRKTQTAFKPDQVRAAFESGALARVRQWSDSTGTFKIKAALIELTEDSVLLRKPDKSEVTVPLEKLSGPDRAYLKKLEKELGPIAPKELEIQEFQQAPAYSAEAWLQAGRVAIAADPIPQDLKLKQGGVVLPMIDFFDKLGGLVPLGGADAMLLAVVVNGTPSEPKPTRLVWTSLDKQKVLGEQRLPGGEVVMDYHAPSRRLLTWSPAKSAGSPTLSLWEVQPTDKQPKPVIRWNTGASWAMNPWARLLDGNSVLHRLAKQEYVVWDAEAKQMRYRLKQESFFGAPAALSGGRKYLVLPEDTRVRVLEAATGKLVSTLPAAQGSSGVAVSPDGVRLAVLDRGNLTVWDLTSPDSAAGTYQAEAVGTPFTADLEWASGDTLAVRNSLSRDMILFSLRLKIALWSYQFDSSAVWEEGGRRLREIVDGHLVYGASVGQAGQNALAVGAVKLPGPKVDEIASTTTRESLLIVKPGSAVSLQVNAGENQARVVAALTKQIQQNGWVLQAGAPNVLTAEMKQGETQSTTYTAQRTGEQQSVTITPHVASLELKVGSVVAWQAGTRSGAPSMMFLSEGQTAQGEADKWNNPRPQFFDTVDLPDSILDPAKRTGLGLTQVTNRGLVPK